MTGLSRLQAVDGFYSHSSFPLPFNCLICSYKKNLAEFTDFPVGHTYFINHSLAVTLLTSDLSVHVLRAIK